MNNILSQGYIDKLNTASTDAVKTIFKDAISDAEFQERQAQRMGVYNRLKLEAVSSYKYFGRQSDGIPVYKRPDSKNNNDANVRLNLKTHKDYPSIIASNKSGYLSGFNVVSSIEGDPAVKKLNTFFKQIDFDSKFNDLVKRSCAYGVKALYFTNNRNTGDLELSELEPWNYAPFYDDNGTLVAVMQWTKISDNVRELYANNSFKIRLTTEKHDLYFLSTSDYVLTYNSFDYPATVTANGLELAEGTIPHGFTGVPVIEFKNNGDCLGDVEKTLDTQDIVDEIKSKASTEMSAFASVTLVNKEKDNDNPLNVTDMFTVMSDYGLLSGDYSWL